MVQFEYKVFITVQTFIHSIVNDGKHQIKIWGNKMLYNIFCFLVILVYFLHFSFLFDSPQLFPILTEYLR